MHSEIKEFLKNNMQSNSEPFNMRMPKDLKEFMLAKAKEAGVDVAQYARNVICCSLLPDVLHSKLQEEAVDWITKQGKDALEVHFGDKINQLKKIVDIAEFAIKETEILQQKFIDAEVECLNKINSKLESS